MSSTLTLSLKNSVFFLVGNIPSSFRSANLRAYFSQYAEKKAFACFHYKHRPEHLRPEHLRRKGATQEERKEQLECTDETEVTPTQQANRGDSISSRCCVVAVKKGFGCDFMKMYQNKNWAHHDGSLLAGKVRISKLSTAPDQPAEDKAGKISPFVVYLWKM